MSGLSSSFGIWGRTHSVWGGTTGFSGGSGISPSPPIPQNLGINTDSGTQIITDSGTPIVTSN